MDVTAPARLADKPSIAQQNTERRHSALQRALALVLANALFWQPILVQAQGVVASNPNTQVGQAGNGVPVVNIAAPNASGLSHNQYQQYNVDAQGLILNNATDTAQATQLGGIIQGNPNLQGQAAGVILNEVTGANPSQLKGYTEVAGQPAKVIVANPHGITCNGCGFINTPQATLSTGKPVLDANGQLQRFNVQGGSVAIEGAGLNASNVEQFDIITRSARINAQLHANKLNVITGRNDVDAQTLAATPLADDGSSKPELAIDSSALGGMYAGAVKLVGTEAGVGVKLAGDLAASGGDIQIDANGQLTMAQSAASGNIVAKARDIDVSAPMYAEGQVQLNADKTLTNRKSIAAGQVVSLQADQLNNSGRVEAGVNADNSRNKTGDVRVAARNMTNQGSVTASRDLTANVDARLDNRKGQLLSQDSLNVSAGQLDNQDGKLLSDNSLTVKGGALDNGNGTLSAIKSVTVQNDRLTNRSDGQVTSGGALNLHVQNLDNLGGMVSARETLTVKTGRFDNSNGTLVGSGGVNLELLQQLTNSNAKVVSGGDLLISGNAQIDNRNGRLSSQGLLSLMAAQVDNRNKGVITANSLSIDAKNIDNQNGTLFSKGRLQLRGSGLDNRNGEIAGNQLDFGLTGALLNSYGVIESSASLTLGAARLDNSQGQIGALGSTGTTELNISGTLDNSRGRLQSANQHMDFSLGRLTNNEGVIAHAGSGRLGLGLPLLQDAGGRVSSNGTLSLSGERWTNSSNVQAANLDLDIATLTQTEGGRLIAAKRFTGRGQNWTNNGLIGADGDLTLSLSGSYTGAGRLTSLGTLELSAPSVLNRGIITSAGDMRLLVNDFTNQRGHLYSLGDLQISADAAGANANSIVNRSGTLTSDGDMLLAARSIQNIRDLLTVNDAGIYSAQINEIACTTAGTGNLDCSGGKEHHVWNIQQLEKLEVTAFSEASSITAGGDITLRGTDFLNSSSTLASSGALTANFSNNFSNIGVVPSTTHTSRTFISERTRSPGGWYALADDFTQRYSQGGARYNANDLGGLEAAMSNFIASTEREVTELRTINRQTPDQQSFAALIQAGGNVSIETGNNFDNRAVQRGFTYVSGGERTNIDAPGTAHATAIRLDSQLSPDLAQQQINPTTLPGFSLPSGQNGLFQLADEASGGALLNTTGAGSHPYLIETNPALTDMRQFLSSSYLLDNLGYNPDTQWKRLGDGYYEQRLVQQAVVSRTGQRYLAGLTSDEATFKYLMDNALASRDALKLSVGVSLTGEQVAALTHDIVWMEEQQVQGQRVLVPVLYLAQADNRLAANGALIQGNDLQLIAGNNLNNVGTLLSRNNLSAKAGSNLLNSGLIQTEQRLALEADNNLINHAGGVISGHDVSLLAKDGSVSNERSVTRHQSAMGASVWREDFADNPARIESAGDLQAKAGKNINNIGGVMQAQGGVRLEAGQDVNIVAAQTQEGRINGANHTRSSVTQLPASVSAGQNIGVQASNDINVIASQVEAQGNLVMNAGNNLNITSAANESQYYSKTKKVTDQQEHTQQVASTLTAKGNVALSAKQDLTVSASQVKAGDAAYLYAGNNLNLLAEKNRDYSLYDMKKKGSFGAKQTQRDEVTDIRHVGTQITTGGDLLLTSGGDQRYQAAQLNSGRNLTLESGGAITFEGVKDLHQESHEKSKSDLAWNSMKGKGRTDETLRQTQMIAQGELAIRAVNGLQIDVKQVDQETVSQAIDAMVKADPQLAWLKDAERRGDVDWRQVKELHDSFKYSHSGLGAGSQLVIAIVMAVVVGPAAMGALGGAGTAVAAGGSAIATSAATTATVSAINNRGNLGTVFKDVTSSDAMKGYAVNGLTASLTAGVYDGITGTKTNPVTNKVSIDLSSMENIGRFAASQTLQSGTYVALSKAAGMEGSFSDALTNSVLNTIAATSFDAVGGLNLEDGSPGKIAWHAFIGGTLAEASGSDFMTGAIAAGANEAVATQLRRKIIEMAPEQWDLLLTAASQLVGVMTVAGVGGDEKALETGAWITKNATQYNFLNHYEMEDFVGDMKACSTPECYQNTWKGTFGDIEYDQLSQDNLADALATVGPARAKALLGEIHGGLAALGDWDCPPEACEYKLTLIDRAFTAKAELQQTLVEGQGIVGGVLTAPLGAVNAGVRNTGTVATVEARGVEKAYAYWSNARGAKAPVSSPLRLGETKAINDVSMTRVGRWMSPDELAQMQSTNKVVQGGGGQTFISTNGIADFKGAASKGSVYVEFDVPANSLLQGGKDGWFKMIGPDASKSQQFLLNKQGGEHLPAIKNIEILDKK
ncbi:DUF637 domain-containing protein [Pseudomonas sp. LJDD11]|uniref:two-partner secretion domain-containing protein n=1 Tax=Pseudomonas sp. LJDD11 TaxID=2931984 RepID=UPI00211BFDF3|nr:DUF637 domain-containing protein [Pseudomonas sp. LJDD11]MCQ9424353.1 DUF637 domain-containing protein [Pseudomonas sp. LJDD11]